MRLTEAIVAAAEPKEKAYQIRDSDLKGFFIVIEPTGTKSFKIQTDIWENKRKLKTLRITLGRSPALSVAEARTQAMAKLSAARQGDFPAARRPKFLGQNSTLEELGKLYAEHLAQKGAAPRTIKDFTIHFEKYLRPHRTMTLGQVKKTVAQEWHADLTRRNGPSIANHVMRSLRAAYNYAIKMDDDDKLNVNPAAAIFYHKERVREAVLMPHELPAWWAACDDLPNPMRAAMHRLGLLSGLRPGTLVQLRRDWVNGQFITVPKEVMKSRREFILPLSPIMQSLVDQAIKYGDVLYPGTPYLFPAANGKHTTVWREKTIQTGHILRKTYRTVVGLCDIPTAQARLLVDHAVSEIEMHYVHPTAMREQLLKNQILISERILGLVE
jgi:integrase